MGMAFGAGIGDQKGTSNEGGSLGAAAGGAGIEPVAMVVVFKGQSGPEGVKMLPLKNPDPLSRAIGEVSSAIVDVMAEGKKMGLGKGKKGEKKTESAKAKTEEKKP